MITGYSIGMSAIWWTGAAVWVGVIAALAWFVWLVLRDACIAAGHLVSFYSFGMPKPANQITFPFKLWWYFFWSAPRYVDRKDVNARIYRPFSKHRPEDEYE